MSTKPQVKIIKRNSQPAKAIDKSAETEARSARTAARKMVSNVSNWVTEFQQNRSEETKDAFNNLFAAPDGCANC